MLEIHEAVEFSRWLGHSATARLALGISVAIKRMPVGAFGDVKSIGGKVFEMRIHYGPGYRVYFLQKQDRFILLICGGDKDSQSRDIAQAREIASRLEISR